jgi:molybdopterin-synthase adenylyltransferase
MTQPEFDNTSPGRYQRQELLPQIGPEGQQRLGHSRVLVVGCGALGSIVCEMLARGGVGFLRIVDRDLVELSNLQRQTLFSECDAADSLPKSIAAANRLREINSHIQIDAVVADVNAASVERLADVDLIVDGTDNVATRYLLNDLAVREGKPWIYGACVAMEGRVWGIWPGVTACLRCLFPEPPGAASLPTCDTAGVLGPAAAVVGSIQAATAIRFLVEGESAARHSSGLMAINVWTGEFRSMASAATPVNGCACCAGRKFDSLSTKAMDFTTNLCGRRSVQVVRATAGTIDLGMIARRWEKLGTIARSPWFVRCALSDPAGIDLTLFADGRLLVHGVTDPMRATSLYARFVGN